MKDLKTWLKHLEQLHPKTMDLGLERIRRGALKLNISKLNSFVITVAGTNGKGSTVALLENILQVHGLNVGAYTSPHLFKFNERIRINGTAVDDQTLCDHFNEIEKNRGEISLTYFEYTTLAALQIFQAASLDIVILEVGLGGRLDAVNIIDPDIAIITNVALDHCHWLGDTREKIAVEKAGIMRANTPVIYGERDVPAAILEHAQLKSAKLYYLGRDFDCRQSDNLYYWHNEQDLQFQCAIPKLHPDNIAIVLQAMTFLANNFEIKPELVQEKAATTQLMGRWQIIKDPVLQIFDVAHNPHAAEGLVKKLQALSNPGKKYAVFSMLEDKDIETTLKILTRHFDYWFIAPLDVPRGMSEAALTTAFKRLAINNYQSFPSLMEAYDKAIATAKAEDAIICFGSFYVVEKVLENICP